MKRLRAILSAMLFACSSGNAMAETGSGIAPGFGVQVEEWRATPAMLDMIKETGFTYIRYGIGWAGTEQPRGTYNWDKIDSFYKSVRERGLNSIFILMGGHPDYTGSIDAPADNTDNLNIYHLSPEKPEDVAAFARFAAATAKHLGSEGIVYEIWNEPDLLDRFWHPKANPEAYAALASATCKAIKEAVPDAKVIGAATASIPGRAWVPGKTEFTLPLLQSPAAACLDGISYHSYRYSRLTPGPKTPESVMDDNKNARAFIDHHAPRREKPLALINTEWGYTLTMLSPEQQAAYVMRTYLSNMLSGVPVTIWYEWQDRGHDDSNSEHYYGLLNRDKTPKLALQAAQAVLPFIKDATFDHRVAMADKDDYAIVLKRPDNTRSLVFWTASPAPDPAARLRVAKDDGETQDYALAETPRHIDLGVLTPKITPIDVRAPAP